MDLTPNGRFVVGAAALLVAGFALAGIAGVQLRWEAGLGLLGAAVGLLLVASRRGRNGS